MVKKQFKGDDGINHITVVKSEYEDGNMGIPADAYHILDEHYKDVPQEFRVRLYNRLWDLGLREPTDFAKPDAKNLYMQALRHAIASDAIDATRFVLERLK